MNIKNLFQKPVDPKTLTNRAQKRKQAKIDRQMAQIEKDIFAKIEQQKVKLARKKSVEEKQRKAHLAALKEKARIKALKLGKHK